MGFVFCFVCNATASNAARPQLGGGGDSGLRRLFSRCRLQGQEASPPRGFAFPRQTDAPPASPALSLLSKLRDRRECSQTGICQGRGRGKGPNGGKRKTLARPPRAWRVPQTLACNCSPERRPPQSPPTCPASVPASAAPPPPRLLFPPAPCAGPGPPGLSYWRRSCRKKGSRVTNGAGRHSGLV